MLRACPGDGGGTQCCAAALIWLHLLCLGAALQDLSQAQLHPLLLSCSSRVLGTGSAVIAEVGLPFPLLMLCKDARPYWDLSMSREKFGDGEKGTQVVRWHWRWHGVGGAGGLTPCLWVSTSTSLGTGLILLPHSHVTLQERPGGFKRRAGIGLFSLTTMVLCAWAAPSLWPGRCPAVVPGHVRVHCWFGSFCYKSKALHSQQSHWLCPLMSWRSRGCILYQVLITVNCGVPFNLP